VRIINTDVIRSRGIIHSARCNGATIFLEMVERDRYPTGQDPVFFAVSVAYLAEALLVAEFTTEGEARDFIYAFHSILS
jgi:hypothetical protein